MRARAPGPTRMSDLSGSSARGSASATYERLRSDWESTAAKSAIQSLAAPAAANKAVGGDGDPTADGAKRKRSWKILLTAELAAEIYAQRPRRGESTGALARP